MDIDQVILGRPLLFDEDVTIHGQSNMYQFLHEDKKIKPLPFWPKVGKSDPNSAALKKIKGVNLISVKDLNQELKNGAPFMILDGKEVVEKTDSTISSEVTMC